MSECRMQAELLNWSQVPALDGTGFMRRWAADDFHDGPPKLHINAPPKPITHALTDRTQLADVLASSNRMLGNPLAQETVDAIRSDAVFVIAGQQPGLFGGPMYSYLKAVSAIRLAQQLQPKFDVPVLPAFWIASEDHDVAEVAWTFLSGHRYVVEHEVLQRGGPRPAVGMLSLEPFRNQLTTFAHRNLGSLPHGETIKQWTGTASYANYTAQFAHIFSKAFEGTPLVFIDALALRELAAPVLSHAMRHMAPLQRAFAEGGGLVRAEGFDAPLASVGIFEFINDHRQPCTFVDNGVMLERGKLSYEDFAKTIEDEPMSFSGGAALRPLVQDALFPNVATIGGPTELLYHWQITPMFDVVDIPRSALHPRISATFIDGPTRQIAEQANLNGPSMFTVLEELATLDQRQQAPLNPDVDQIQQVGRNLLQLLEQQRDATNAGWMDKARQSVSYQLDKVVRLLNEQHRESQGKGKTVLRRLADRIFPLDIPQERVMNLLDFVARFGVAFVPATLEHLDPVQPGHHVVHIDTAEQ